MSESKLLKIRALTNMHVGNGDTNFGVIDNMVQRDVVTRLPNINASSLKGALRDYISIRYKNEPLKVQNIFGPESTDTKNKEMGDYKFFDARLLAIPVRSMQAPYYLATCPMILEELLEYNRIFNEDNKEIGLIVNSLLNQYKGKDIALVDTEEPKIDIEDFRIEVKKEIYNQQKENIKNLLGNKDEIVILSNQKFQELASKNLPVIARNKLINRKSDNVWYEEIVPRESIFYTAIWHQPNGNKESVVLDEVIGLLVNARTIQIGANATIGYGYTEFTVLGDE